jgi:hypothetical protein
MGLLLAVLAYMVYVIMNCGDKNETTPTTTATGAMPAATPAGAMAGAMASAAMAGSPMVSAAMASAPMAPAPVSLPESSPASETMPTGFVSQQPATNTAGFSNIVYERFANVGGLADSLNGAAPFKNNTLENDDKYATVKYTGLVDANPEDVLQIEGTDLLTAPLVDNMLYTNSIANTNRNASQDLRGDLPLQFNESYTPFYSSVIYGAPLSEKTMTIS